MFERKGEEIKGRDGRDLTRYVQIGRPVICNRCHRPGGTLVKREIGKEKEYLHPWCLR